MKKFIYIILLLFLQTGLFAQSAQDIPCEDIATHPLFLAADTLPAVVNSIPETFEESLLSLDTLLNEYQKRYLECLGEGALSTPNIGLGSWMGDYWIVADSTQLYDDMYSRGVLQSYDMSGIIITAYYRQLHDLDINLETLIRRYHSLYKN